MRKPHVRIWKGVWRVTHFSGWFVEGYTIPEAWFTFTVALKTPEWIE